MLSRCFGLCNVHVCMCKDVAPDLWMVDGINVLFLYS